jgi:hypothetical protein
MVPRYLENLCTLHLVVLCSEQALSDRSSPGNVCLEHYVQIRGFREKSLSVCVDVRKVHSR